MLPLIQERMSAKTKICPLCGGAGWRPIEREGLRAVETCDCRKVQRDQSWWMDRARIPRRHRQCDLANFEVLDESRESLFYALGKARLFVEEYPLSEKGLLFLGNPGVGKTHLAVAIVKHLMTQKGAECLFVSYQELLQRIRDSYDPVSLSTESQVLHPVLNTEVVVIDDLGANRITDWVEDTITYILNYRYNEQKTTILTSNLPDTADEVSEQGSGGKYGLVDTLTKRIGIRVRSRLYEMCQIVKIGAKDFRQTVQSHSH